MTIAGRAALPQLPRREARAVRLRPRHRLRRRTACPATSPTAPTIRTCCSGPSVEQLCLSCHSQTGGPQDVRLAAAVVPRPRAAPLPQLHDVPRRRARVEPLAAAAEVGIAMRHALAAASHSLLASAADAGRGRLALGRRRFRSTSRSAIAGSTSPATSRCTGRRSTTGRASCCVRSTTPPTARSGNFFDYFHVDASDIGAGPAGQLRLAGRAGQPLQADLHLARDGPLQRAPGLREPVPRRRDHPGPADLQPHPQHLRRPLELLPGQDRHAPPRLHAQHLRGPGHDDLPPRAATNSCSTSRSLGRRALPGRPRLSTSGPSRAASRRAGGSTAGTRSTPWLPGAGAGNVTTPVLGPGRHRRRDRVRSRTTRSTRP